MLGQVIDNNVLYARPKSRSEHEERGQESYQAVVFLLGMLEYVNGPYA